jgi:hypothetical protein
MPRRTQLLFLLLGLLVLFVVVVYLDFRPPEAARVSAATSEQFVPLPVENPALRVDLLDRLKKFQYHGTGRNIFSDAPAPPPAAAKVSALAAAKPSAPAPPPGPPPLVVPATFFGYVTDARTGTRRAFFNEGDDVYVVAVGETLLGRFRLLQIGNNTAELEEMATGRRATLTMAEGPGSS